MIAQQRLSTEIPNSGIFGVILSFGVVSLAYASPFVLLYKLVRHFISQQKRQVIKRNPYESLRHTGSLGVYSRYTSVTYSLPKPPRFDGLPGSRYN